jgi:hypothetical protein
MPPGGRKLRHRAASSGNKQQLDLNHAGNRRVTGSSPAWEAISFNNLHVQENSLHGGVRGLGERQAVFWWLVCGTLRHAIVKSSNIRQALL